MFLGHMISSGGIAIDPCKVEVVLHWEIPKCVTDIITFHGLTNYYRRFMKAFRG